MDKNRIYQLASYGRMRVGLNEHVGIITSFIYERNAVAISFDTFEGIYPVYHIMPYLRSIKSIGCSIIVDGYNNNMPFIPMDHLIGVVGNVSTLFRLIDIDNEKMTYKIGVDDTLYVLRFGWEQYDLLTSWQFDYRGWITQKKAKELYG